MLDIVLETQTNNSEQNRFLFSWSLLLCFSLVNTDINIWKELIGKGIYSNYSLPEEIVSTLSTLTLMT